MGRHRSAGPSSSTASRLLALPWVTLVLLALVAAGVVGVLQPAVFEARSTVTASVPRAASDAVLALSDPDLLREVEAQVELAPDLRRSVRLSVERPDGRPFVVVRAEAPDPRLAAVAADTAAALVVQDVDELSLTEAAVVPTGPVGGGSWWPWALVGTVALALAVLVERRQDLRERAAVEREAPPADAGPAQAGGAP